MSYYITECYTIPRIVYSVNNETKRRQQKKLIHLFLDIALQ